MRLFLGSTSSCLKHDAQGRPVVIGWSGLGGIVLMVIGTVMAVWTLRPLAAMGWWPGLRWGALLWLPAAAGIALGLFGLNAAFERQRVVFDKHKGVVHFKTAWLFERSVATFPYDSARLRIYRCERRLRRGGWRPTVLATLESWALALDLPKGQVLILHCWTFGRVERAAQDWGRELGLRYSRAAGTMDPPDVL